MFTDLSNLQTKMVTVVVIERELAGWPVFKIVAHSLSFDPLYESAGSVLIRGCENPSFIPLF
jgi:hypothetical protein